MEYYNVVEKHFFFLFTPGDAGFKKKKKTNCKSISNILTFVKHEEIKVKMSVTQLCLCNPMDCSLCPQNSQR